MAHGWERPGTMSSRATDRAERHKHLQRVNEREHVAQLLRRLRPEEAGV